MTLGEKGREALEGPGPSARGPETAGSPCGSLWTVLPVHQHRRPPMEAGEGGSPARRGGQLSEPSGTEASFILK